MGTYAINGIRPVVADGAFVHETAVLIGDVVIATGCYIGPGASLRGDYGRIEIGRGANIQDNCVVHSFPGRTVIVEEDGHVGHGAILHGCAIGRNALVGMNAVIMDNAEIGADCIVGALSFVKARTITPPGTLWAGSPAKEIRSVSDKEKAWKSTGTHVYQELARRCAATLVPCEPLRKEEEGRPRLEGGFIPLPEWRERG